MRTDVVKRLFLVFFVGGCFGLFSQVLVALWRVVLGPDSTWLMPAMLVTLGLVGTVLYVAGIYQKLEEKAAMGAIMPFSGLVSAVAGAFLEGNERKGMGAGVLEGFKFFLYVLGIGACVSAVVAVVVALAA